MITVRDFYDAATFRKLWKCSYAINAEICAWNSSHNAATSKTNWQFSTDKARRKLKNLYPHIR